MSSGVPVDATITCASKAGEQVDCADGERDRRGARSDRRRSFPGRATRRSRTPREPSSPIVDRGGNPAATTEADFAAPTQVEQSSPAISYALALGVVVERVRRLVRDGAPRGRDRIVRVQGQDRHVVHGHRGRRRARPRCGSTATRRARSTSTHPRCRSRWRRSFRHLAKGDHTITIRVLGTGRRPGRRRRPGRGRCDRGGRQGHLEPGTGGSRGGRRRTRARPEATSP